MKTSNCQNKVAKLSYNFFSLNFLKLLVLVRVSETAGNIPLGSASWQKPERPAIITHHQHLANKAKLDHDSLLAIVLIPLQLNTSSAITSLFHKSKVGHLDFFAKFTLGVVSKHYQTSQRPLHPADLSGPIWSCFIIKK